MAAETPSYVLRPEPDNIPRRLKRIPRWVNWRAGPLKQDGRFDKVPIDPTTGRAVDALSRKNQRTFDEAIAAYNDGRGDGIGIVLSADHPVKIDGQDFYLTVLDFDHCRASMKKLKSLWLWLGKPYFEVSPSGNGVHMFALSTLPLAGGNDGKGHELYSGKRFMTVTGIGGRGGLIDTTAGLVSINDRLFSRYTKVSHGGLGNNTAVSSTMDKSKCEYLLSFISSDTDYATWRDLVWSIMASGCRDAIEVARLWSKKAPHRYDERAFEVVVRDYDPNNGSISAGTLYHHAMQNGWIKGNEDDLRDESSNQRFKLLTASEILSQPDTPYLVRGILPTKGIAAIYGESGSGKSFLAMDLTLSIAAGTAEWFGMKVRSAPVVYAALEGRGGIKKRVKAWELHYNRALSPNVRFLCADFDLRNDDNISALAPQIVTTVGLGAVVVLDTLNRASPGADENGPADMSRIVSNAQRLADQVHGLVILVHHSGKDRSRGMRGHSSLIAAMDAAIEVVRSSSGRSWNVAKSKDDEGDASYGFELVPYSVGSDEDGLDNTSCAVRRAINAPAPKAKPLTGKHQVAAMAKLRQLLAGTQRGLAHEVAVREVAAVLDCAQGRRLSVAKETLDRLLAGSHLFMNDEGVGVP